MILGVSASPSTKLPRPVPKDSGVAFLQTNHHPIKLHNDDGSANWAEVHARHHAITARYGGYDGRTRKRYTENVTTVESGTFYLNYVVGNPPQKLQALLDSGSDVGRVNILDSSLDL